MATTAWLILQKQMELGPLIQPWPFPSQRGVTSSIPICHIPLTALSALQERELLFRH